MKRFAQSQKTTEDPYVKEFGQKSKEAAEKEARDKEAIEKYKKDNANLIEFLKALASMGKKIKDAANYVKADQAREELGPILSSPIYAIKSALAKFGDELINKGNDLQAAVNAAYVAELSTLGVSALHSSRPRVQRVTRYLPFIGDVVNLTYFNALTVESFTDPLQTIFSGFKCNSTSTHKGQPTFSGLYPNFSGHPEFFQQYKNKLQAVADLTNNISICLQVAETGLSAVALVTGGAPAYIAVRAVGALIQAPLFLFTIVISPNTTDIATYSKEGGFKGGGTDPKGFFGFINKIPGLKEYAQYYESKPIAEEIEKLSNFSYLPKVVSVDYQKDLEEYLVTFSDSSGRIFTLSKGQVNPDTKIKLLGLNPDPGGGRPGWIEIQNESGSIFRIPVAKITNKTGEAFFVTKQPFYNEKIFNTIMQEGANLKTGGNVQKFLSLPNWQILRILDEQLKYKYNWIGDGKNPNWVNLQADIVSHKPLKKLYYNDPSKKKQSRFKITPTGPVDKSGKPIVLKATEEEKVKYLIPDYKEKYIYAPERQLIPERTQNAVRTKLAEVIQAIREGKLSSVSWNKWSEIGKISIIEEAIDRLQNAGFGILNPGAPQSYIPPISNDILNQLSPKYRPRKR